jgi:dTMP kinase
MFAARREHLEQVIRPALQRGVYVISDRFTDASFAYQCGGRGVAADKVEQLERWVQGDFQPDLTLLFDVPVAISTQRLVAARDPDRFERERAEFFDCVRHAYLERAARFPQRFHVIDASKPLTEVKILLDKIIATI